jgi:thiol-disulfide isomerase/thioredoxin
MSRMFRLLVPSAMAIALLLAPTPAVQADDNKDAFAPLIGKPAPEIAPEYAVHGKPVSLADLKGKVVLVDFWAVWCPPCRAALPHVRELSKEYKDKGLEVIGVTSYFGTTGFDKKSGDITKLSTPMTEKEEQEMLKDFSGHNKLGYHVEALSKTDWAKVSKEYKVEGIPTMVLIDRKGDVRMVKVGASEENYKAIETEVKKLLAENGRRQSER